MRKQIKYFLIVLLLFVLAGTGFANAATFQATDENIAETNSEELIYVIGTHLFTEETSYISTQIMMYAARTIDIPEGVEGQDALEYMKVYSRDLEGNWIEAISGETVDLSGVEFDIQYKDLEKYVVTTANVKNVTELEEALANPDITTINFIEGDKFETDHSILVSKPVTINGNGQTITFTGESGEWRKDTENYVVKVYNTEATIKDITLTGANAALLVNSSDVVLEGTINVDGNAFGGIEVSKGAAEGLEKPSLDITKAMLEHEEILENPTIWEDGVNDCIIGGDLVKVTGVKVGQVFYFNIMPEANVASVAELEHALQTNLEVINLQKGTYETDHVIVVDRDVTINGNENIIRYVGETGSWSGGSGDNYVLQVYNAEATIKDLGFTGASAGLLVNASKVTLEGTIDVSGNTFGGIEVSKGVGEGLEMPHLTVAKGASLVNNNESITNPTIWEDKVDNCVTTELTKIEDAKEGEDQNFYFNQSPIVDVDTLEELETALNNNKIITINLTSSFTTDHSILVSKPVTINGNGQTITFTGTSGKWREDTENYVVKVYNTEVTIKDLTLTGANAALLVNSSDVVLEGAINVDGNAFGGIEVSKGTAEGLENPSLDITNATLEHKEVLENPTVWEDGVNDCIIGGNLVKVTGVKVGQVFYFNVMPEANVTSVAELEHALQTNLEVINLQKGTYETDHVIVVDRDVTINGNENIIRYVGETGSWSGGSGDNYVLQVYNAEATIKDLGFTGASAGLLVNASKVTLEGTIDVSGNTFGGIEVSKGVAEGLSNGQLTVDGTIIMNNEERTVPVIWIEKDQGTVTGSGVDGYYATTETNNKEQTYYYSDEKYATTGRIESSDELLGALTNENIDSIELTKDAVIETEGKEPLALDKKITINGNGATIKSKLNITGNEVKIQDVKLNNTVAVTGENVVLDKVEMTGFDTGYSKPKPSGVSLIKVASDGPFTLTNSTISKVTGTAYNLINVATAEKIVIENNTFGIETGDLKGIYNLIEFSQAKNKAIKDGTIIRNNVFNSKTANNVISMFNIEDGATITIENNTFAYSGNALRLSNYFNTSATFNIYNNTVLDGSNDAWGGFICFQAVGKNAPEHAGTYFAKYTINVKNLVGTDGNVVNTIEGNGTGANRVGYYYADYSADNTMPDSAKAKVNFIKE